MTLTKKQVHPLAGLDSQAQNVHVDAQDYVLW